MSVDSNKEVVIEEIVTRAFTRCGARTALTSNVIEDAARESFDAGIEHCKVQLLEQLAVQLGVDGRVFLAS